MDAGKAIIGVGMTAIAAGLWWLSANTTSLSESRDPVCKNINKAIEESGDSDMAGRYFARALAEADGLSDEDPLKKQLDRYQGASSVNAFAVLALQEDYC